MLYKMDAYRTCFRTESDVNLVSTCFRMINALKFTEIGLITQVKIYKPHGQIFLSALMCHYVLVKCRSNPNIKNLIKKIVKSKVFNIF